MSIFGKKPGGIPLGYEWNPRTGKYGKRITFTGKTAPHLLLLGPNGSGKGTRLLIPALLELTGRSVVVIAPFGLLVEHDPSLKSAGFNPLVGLSPASPTFYDDAAGLAEALIRV